MSCSVAHLNWGFGGGALGSASVSLQAREAERTMASMEAELAATKKTKFAHSQPQPPPAGTFQRLAVISDTHDIMPGTKVWHVTSGPGETVAIDVGEMRGKAISVRSGLAHARCSRPHFSVVVIGAGFHVSILYS